MFDALMIVPHALTFPACSRRPTCWVPASRPPLGSTPFWHGGFPLFVITYAVLRTKGRWLNRIEGNTPAAFVGVIARRVQQRGQRSLTCFNCRAVLAAVKTASRRLRWWPTV